MCSSQKIKDLLRRIREGDREARQQLMTLLADESAFGSVMIAMTRRKLPHDHPARRLVDSRDILQSAICTAIEKFRDFRGETEQSLFGWLSSIIRTKVRLAQKPIQNESRYKAETQDSENYLKRLIDEELVNTLHEAIQELPLDQRLVVELQLRGFNSSKVGEILGMKPATVRKREQRAVANLKEIFRKKSSPQGKV